MTLPRLECAWDMPIEAAEHLVSCIRFRNASGAPLAAILHDKHNGTATVTLLDMKDSAEEPYCGWMCNTAGHCPVDPLQKVRVRFRTGMESQKAHWAAIYRWEKTGESSDIVQYRVEPEDDE